MSERKKKNTIEKSDSVDKNDQSEASKLEKILDDIIKVCPKMKDDKQFIINKLTSSKIDSNIPQDPYFPLLGPARLKFANSIGYFLLFTSNVFKRPNQ